MRKNKISDKQKEFSILTLDDDKLITETIQSYFQTAGYYVDTENDPTKVVDRIREKKYDILLLDFLMRPICGDEVVRQIRQFDKELFIILLTGHKSMAPPIKTIKELDIQGYFEKSERFDQLELLIESCAKSITQMRTIRSYRDGLTNILNDIPKLKCRSNINELFDEILRQIKENLNCNDGFVYLDLTGLAGAPKLTENIYIKSMGKYKDDKQFGKDLFEYFKSGNKEIIYDKENKLYISPLFSEEQQLYGIIGAGFENETQNESLQLFDIYSKQVGSIVSNMILHCALQQQNEQLKEAFATMRKNYMETINAMRLMVDAKDFYTRGHSERVSYYAVEIGKALHKDEEYLEKLRVAGLFHDIGKIGISDDILRKNDKLTQDERTKIMHHPVIGKKLLSTISSFAEIIPIIEAHHENFDGTGYPNGISKYEIPEESRIISVADSFDAMTSKRSYRNSLLLSQAIEELEKGKNSQFDGEIVDAFVKTLAHFDDMQEQLKSTFCDVE